MAKKLKEWFDAELAKLLSDKLSVELPGVNGGSFVREVENGVGELELKDRVELIADSLYEHIPGEYQEKLRILVAILGPENRNETGMFTEGYWVMPIAKFVEKYGLKYLEDSLDAIAEITKRNTGEYAIRPYLRRYPEQTLKRMNRWAEDKNVHLRRLASEGVRIKLPWATKLEEFQSDPSPILTIIEKLKDDESRFVQKSVANNLNDILKVNREFGRKIVERWKNGANRNRRWVLRHALRTLRKKNDPWALALTSELE